MDTYYIPKENLNTSEIIIKKSRFIANLKTIFTKDDALNFISECKGKYKDARHNCYAYLIGKPASPISIGYSDDGEPKGTAGPPILSVIRQKNISMVCIVIARYFGGIKLGAGGLIRAYSGAANDVIDKTGITTYEKMINLNIKTDYLNINSILTFLSQKNITVLNSDYNIGILLSIEVKEKIKDSIIGQITELTRGSAKIHTVDKQSKS